VQLLYRNTSEIPGQVILGHVLNVCQMGLCCFMRGVNMHPRSIGNGSETDDFKDANRFGEGWRVQARSATSMAINTEGENRIESQVEFWVLVLADAGMIAVSMLGLALYWHMTRMFK
jgi:hypothetical protein